MPVVHYLNVKNGDCSIIQHGSSRVSVIDVCNAKDLESFEAQLDELAKGIKSERERGILGNFNQKAYPVNPIKYMRDRNINDVFRFILTGPDMDHMDGIKAFFEAFRPTNFWDTDNEKECGPFAGSPYSEDDWLFYKKLRDGAPATNPKRLALYDRARGPFYTEDGNGNSGGDALYVLAPTAELLQAAKEGDDYNDSSYVILYCGPHGRVLFSGDSHDRTWEHLLANHEKDISNIDVLIAPHHGRHSDRDFKFLDTVKPKITFFGNAPSEHLAYDAWRRRGLLYITNNQANCIVADVGQSNVPIFVTNEKFARAMRADTYWDGVFSAWWIGNLK